jgi:hypothetical protein
MIQRTPETIRNHQNYREETIDEVSRKILSISIEPGFQEGCRYASYEARTKYTDLMKETYENGFYFNDAAVAIFEIKKSEKLLKIIGIEPKNKEKYFDSIESIDNFAQGYSITVNAIYEKINSIENAKTALSVVNRPAKKELKLEDIFSM